MSYPNTVFIHRKTTSLHFEPDRIYSTFGYLLGRKSAPSPGTDWAIDKVDVGPHIPKTLFEQRDKSGNAPKEEGVDYSFIFAFDEEMIKEFGNRTNFTIEGGQFHPKRRDANLNEVIAEEIKGSEKITSVNFDLIPKGDFPDRELLLRHMLILRESDLEGNRTHREVVHCGDIASELLMADLMQDRERLRDMRLMETYLASVESTRREWGV